MKIIAVGMNYALHNKELGHTHENKEPVIFLKPDSAILKDGKPFFIPDFSNEVHYETEVVVRICRLGKNIAPRFAHRYYDSAAIGTFVPLEQVGGNVQNLDFHLTIDDKEVQRGHTADMLFRVDEIIAYVSRFMTLKIGDLLFTGTPVGVGPVSIGQHLQGYLGEEKVLDFNIR